MQITTYSIFSAPSVSPFSSQSKSTLDSVDYKHVKSLAETKQSRGKYIKFSQEDRLTIGRYAAVHEPLAAVRKFKDQYPNLNESSVRTFRDKYNKKLKASGNSQSPAKKIVTTKHGRPLMLGALDEKIKNFLFAIRKMGGVVNTVVAIATAKALIEKSDEEYLSNIEIFLGKKLISSYGFRKTCRDNC